jgi:hypothetical protein
MDSTVPRMPMDSTAPRIPVDSTAPREPLKPNVVDFAWELPGCMTSKLPQPGRQAEYLELCIPSQAAYLDEVRAILAPERELTEHLDDGGRIGCDETQYLIVFDYQLLPASTLCALAQLSYVERIAWTIINI